MESIAEYLEMDPNLRSLTLDGNDISDDGLLRISQALFKNFKLAHLSFKRCPKLTDYSLEFLCSVVGKDNTVLFSLNFDREKFDGHVATKILEESYLNRAIME